MEITITVVGRKMTSEGEVTVEAKTQKVIGLGCGIKYELEGTRFLQLGRCLEINEPDQMVCVESELGTAWINVSAIKDVISKDDLANSTLQNLIDSTPIKQ